MKAYVTIVTFETLTGLLGLPPGDEVIGVVAPDGNDIVNRTAQLVIKGGANEHLPGGAILKRVFPAEKS